MHVYPEEISENIKEKLKTKNPDLLLYMDNPYIENLIDNLIEVISEELAEIKNDYVNKKDFNKR